MVGRSATQEPIAAWLTACPCSVTCLLFLIIKAPFKTVVLFGRDTVGSEGISKVGCPGVSRLKPPELTSKVSPVILGREFGELSLTG